MRILSLCSLVGFVLVGVLSAPSVRAEDLFLAADGAFPGQLWLSEGGTAERLIHRRMERPDPAYPRAITKLDQVAIGPGGKVFFASGLDGSIMHLLDGRNEIQSFEVEGQVRDLACTSEDHVVYYSVVPTPQNGEPLADGVIYRRDLWEGRPSVVATIRQADVGGDWWGTFTIHQGAVILSTLGRPASRLYKLTGDGPVRIFAENGNSIRGLASSPDGAFYFTTGTRKVYKTNDFVNLQLGVLAERTISDVSLVPAARP